jgi:hypothetical protein
MRSSDLPPLPAAPIDRSGHRYVTFVAAHLHLSISDVMRLYSHLGTGRWFDRSAIDVMARDHHIDPDRLWAGSACRCGLVCRHPRGRR